jgi:hypothetical protein
MSINNYAQKGNNGGIVIDCNNVPDKAFLDANKTKTIAQARIMTKEEKASSPDFVPGGPDVILKYSTGERKLITRKELTSNFTHSSGNKIIIPFLKSNKQYYVYSNCSEKYKIMKLPENCIAILPNGTKSKPGCYIVAKEDANGQVDKSTISSMSPKLFRKSFKVPMQPAIQRHMNGGGSKSSKSFKLFNRDSKPMMNTQAPMKSRIDTSEIGMNPANIHVSSINDTQKAPTTWTPTMNGNHNIKVNTQKTPLQPKAEVNKYPYKVTASLVDIEGRQLGYILQDNKSGKTRNVKVTELMQLCKAKTVENVKLVQNTSGKLYLQGNGCSLTNLPKIMK